MASQGLSSDDKQRLQRDFLSHPYMNNELFSFCSIINYIFIFISLPTEYNQKPNSIGQLVTYLTTDPGDKNLVLSHTFVEIDQEIIFMVILLP